jgi:hypothetical protein
LRTLIKAENPRIREFESPRKNMTLAIKNTRVREGRYAAEVLSSAQEAHDVDAHEVEACGR